MTKSRALVREQYILMQESSPDLLSTTSLSSSGLRPSYTHSTGRLLYLYLEIVGESTRQRQPKHSGLIPEQS